MRWNDIPKESATQEQQEVSNFYLKKLFEIGKKKKTSSLKKELAKDPQWKSRYQDCKGQMGNEYEYIRDLIMVLIKKQLHYLCIFWGDRFLQCCDHRDKRTKRNVLSTIFLSYYSIEKHEMALKFGHDTLTIPLDPMDIEHSMIDLILITMACTQTETPTRKVHVLKEF